MTDIDKISKAPLSLNEARVIELARIVRNAHARHLDAAEKSRLARVALQDANKELDQFFDDLNVAREELDAALRSLATGGAS